MKKYLFIIFAIVFMIPTFAQQEENHDVNSEIKELTEFHDVIYQIWHTAWPQKDIKLLRSFVREIEKGFKAIKNAKLPGILRDKQTKWNDGLKSFASTIDIYKKSAAKKDSVGILDAAEKLHSQYEALVRIVKPVSLQMENFHKELYMLYHHYLPNYDYEKIKRAVTMLRARNESVFVSKLPERLKAKQEAFDKAKIELDSAVQDLFGTVINSDDKRNITKALEVVHTKYQELEKIFD